MKHPHIFGGISAVEAKKMFYLVSDQRHKDLGREVEPKTQYQVILFSPRNVASLGISTSFLFFFTDAAAFTDLSSLFVRRAVC